MYLFMKFGVCMYLFLAVQGLHGCTWAFSSCDDGRHLLLHSMGLWLTALVALRHMKSSWIGVESVFPALAGGFLTSGPPEKLSDPTI